MSQHLFVSAHTRDAEVICQSVLRICSEVDIPCQSRLARSLATLVGAVPEPSALFAVIPNQFRARDQRWYDNLSKIL